MATVFVIQEPKPGKKGFTYDISPCLKFGQPVMVFSQEDQPGLTPGPSIFQARKVLAGMEDGDYLLWAGGDPVGFAVVCMVVNDLNVKVNFLRWERERDQKTGERTGRGFYLPVALNLRQRG